MCEHENIVKRAEATASRMLGEGDQHAATAIQELLEELVEETEAADNWRKLAATPAADAGNPASKLSVPVGLPESIPSGMCLVNAGALQMVINALRRDAEEGKAVRGEMADELLATVRQAPKPVVHSVGMAPPATSRDPAVLGWVRRGKNGRIGNHFHTYEPHCDVAVRDDGGEKIAVIAAPVHSPQADALDAARYRFLRDTCWSSDKELATAISLQINKVWDEKIDEAMARNKKE